MATIPEVTTQLNTTTECITNHIHIETYQHSFTCKSFCKSRFNADDCANGTCICICGLSILLIISAVIFGIWYAGYLVVLEANKTKQEANEYNIIGQCIITFSEETFVNKTGSLGSDESYWRSRYQFKVSPNNSNVFPCTNLTKIYEDSEKGKLKDNGYGISGDKFDCYTNENCDEIYMSDTEDWSGFIYSGAVIIFSVILCVFCGCFCAMKYYEKYVMQGMKEFGECCAPCCNICSEYKKWRVKRKHDYYKSKWVGLKGWKQCDYVLSNWSHNNEVNDIEGGITNDIFRIINEYLRKGRKERRE